MPELPEVQTTVNGIKEHAVGLRIVDVWTDYNSPFHKTKDNIKNPKFFAFFKKEIVGATITDASRRAKNILIHLDNENTILIHMKMTGHVLYGTYVFNKKKKEWMATQEGPLRDPFNRFIHLVFTLSNKKHLVLSDMRKFAKVTLFKTEHLHIADDLEHIGPEPLSPSFTVKDFEERLNMRPNGKIKPVLMDQTIIAGIGNIYSDEMLWDAGIHPELPVSKLTKTDFKKMYDAMKKILNRSISLGGDSMSDYRNLKGEKGGFHPYHNAYMQTGKPCTRKGCKGTIRRKKVAGRSAHYCDLHQSMR
jgi:formamidopyrimidine-DNA glycosylase